MRVYVVGYTYYPIESSIDCAEFNISGVFTSLELAQDFIKAKFGSSVNSSEIEVFIKNVELNGGL